MQRLLVEPAKKARVSPCTYAYGWGQWREEDSCKTSTFQHKSRGSHFCIFRFLGSIKRNTSHHACGRGGRDTCRTPAFHQSKTSYFCLFSFPVFVNNLVKDLFFYILHRARYDELSAIHGQCMLLQVLKNGPQTMPSIWHWSNKWLTSIGVKRTSLLSFHRHRSQPYSHASSPTLKLPL